jgi:hypothetical protein
VLLGASNVARGISVITETSCQVWGRPLEIFAAHGHGRSYGRASSLLGRELPGIAACGLWDTVAARPALPTAALVTDVGNDIIYERSVDEICVWVDGCLARLAALGARTVITRLPLDNLFGLTEWRFLLFRKLFFPKCRLRLDEVSDRARRLDALLVELAARYGATTVVQQRAWYGFDPIHIALGQMAPAWRAVLGHWSDAPLALPLARRAAGRELYLRSVFPERRKLFGFEQRARQPAGRLPSGTTLWFY